MLSIFVWFCVINWDNAISLNFQVTKMVKWKSLKWLVSFTHKQRNPSEREINSKDDMSVPSALKRQQQQAPPKPPRSGQIFTVKLQSPEKRGDVGIHLGEFYLSMNVYHLT